MLFDKCIVTNAMWPMECDKVWLSLIYVTVWKSVSEPTLCDGMTKCDYPYIMW